jgi:hypothetical protein
VAFGKPQPTALGRIGTMGSVGGTMGIGQAIEEGATPKETLIRGAIGTGIGAATSGAVEALGAAIRGISQSKGVQKVTGGVYTKELQPS